MEPELQRRVQRYGWDRASLYYEGYWQQQLKPVQDLLMEWADIRPGDKILDVACGTGLVSLRARAAAGDQGYVLGTDISEKMVELATSRSKEKFSSALDYKHMDAESLQIEEGQFDIVLCALGLMYFPDPYQALREMYRVLKPGGKAVAAVWGSRDHCGWAEIFEIVDQRVSSEVCPMFFQLGNPGMLTRSLESAGFQHTLSNTFSARLLYSSGEEACGAAFMGGPVALAYHKFTEPVKREAEQAYLESILPYKEGTGYAVPGEFIVAKGFKV
jgi:ubiquinone/menaquinone biosynthesis C-methylase UbiE